MSYFTFRLVAVALVCGLGQIGLSADAPSFYQKVAERTDWPEFEKLDSFPECFAKELRDYKLQATRSKLSDDLVKVRILDDNDTEIYVFDATLATPFVERDGVLYYALYPRHSDGCELVAYDLKRRKQLWRSRLEGIGAVIHSIYGNEVRFRPSADKDVLMVVGRESRGRYIEIVNLKTGETVGHKQFPREEEKSP